MTSAFSLSCDGRQTEGARIPAASSNPETAAMEHVNARSLSSVPLWLLALALLATAVTMLGLSWKPIAKFSLLATCAKRLNEACGARPGEPHAETTLSTISSPAP